MCGILAILLNESDKRKKLKKKIKALVRRGPDEIGHFENEDIFIGHTRLSIVHPEAGSQPIHYKGWVGSLNGEIYNASPADNETDCHHLIKSIVEHGMDSIVNMDGMFSFVLYHPETKRVIMGRDRIGITPMYYSDTVVSSLLVCQDDRPKCVPIGSITTFILGETPKWKSYMDPYAFRGPTANSLINNGPTDNYLKNSMFKAVTKRLMGDVPWGVLLSGGLDSSIVAAIAVAIAEAHRPDYPKVHSFCIGLKNSPDMLKAKKLAEHLGTFHTAVEYTVEEGLAAIKDVIKAVETYDVTTIRASTPMWLLGKVISKRGIKMVLSGEGSDELFAGYLYNLYCPGPEEMAAECSRKISQLYAYDCLRANKSMGDWGIETRVPFLDNDIVNFAMNEMDPTNKLSGTHPSGPKPEKWVLRDTFRDMLPDYIVDRTKAQFSDAVGSLWIDSLMEYAEKNISDAQLEIAADKWSYQTPDTKEAYMYREIFEELFGDINGSSETVIYQPSIACSSEVATRWHENFKKCLDPSGDAIQRVFKDS